MSEKIENQTEGKEIAEVSDDEIATLMAQNAQLQAKENEGDGVKADYILLAKTGSKALKKSQKDLFIEGLAVGDFYIQKEKVNLGDTLKVVPLAFITLYDEVEDKPQNAQFFGVWNKEQAVTYPVADGSYFNRQLPNGHILKPKNWVMIEVLDHPEIENAVIAYKSTGSRIWKKWKEDAKQRSQSSATLVYEIKEEVCSNENNEWTDIGFEYVASLLETDKVMAVKCLKKSNNLRESYEKHVLIGNHDTQSLTAPRAPVAQIADSSDVEDSYDDELGF